MKHVADPRGRSGRPRLQMLTVSLDYSDYVGPDRGSAGSSPAKIRKNQRIAPLAGATAARRPARSAQLLTFRPHGAGSRPTRSGPATFCARGRPAGPSIIGDTPSPTWINPGAAAAN